MEMELYLVIPIILPSAFVVWMGSLYLRRNSVVFSMGIFWAALLVMFVGMFLTQLVGAYFDHQALVEDWRWGDPPEFNMIANLLPMIMIVPVFILFGIVYRNTLAIFNIMDEDLALSLTKTLGELKWEYDRDFTYIHVKDPEIKIKVGMMDPVRTCHIFFRDVKDQVAVRQFKEILTSRIKENKVKPFWSIGLLFIFMGLILPLLTVIMMIMI